MAAIIHRILFKASTPALKSRDWIESRRNRPDAWFTTWAILDEFMRATTHPRVMRTPWSARRAWAFVSTLLGSQGLGVLIPTERHADVAGQVIAELPWVAGNLIHDARTAILMREHGILRICTRGTDFHRFAFLEVVDLLDLRSGVHERGSVDGSN
jgi:predicted nucleic acid-binding protein